MATDDFTLVRRVRSGDQRAFKLLMERYQRRVYALALGMVKDREEAMDISQEAFAKIYKYLDHFKGDSSFYTWLYRITLNLCIDALRKGGAGKREQVEFDETAEIDMSEAHIGTLGTMFGTNPQGSILRKELAEKVEEALQQITEKHRAIVLLRELEGMPYEDLARTLRIPKGTVMSRLFHARHKLQKILSDYLELDDVGKGKRK